VRLGLLDPLDEGLLRELRARLPARWELACAASARTDDQAAAARSADAVLVIWSAVSRPVLEASASLRLVQKLGVGVDKVDLECCRERGVAVARLAGVNAPAVAEHVVMLVLASLRRLASSDRRVRAGEWFKEEARAFQRQLRAKTVGLVGLGHVGTEVAKRLRPFEVLLLYTDLRRAPRATERRLGLRFVGLDELLASSDVVSLHVPYSPSSANLLSAERIAQLREGAVVVNCARGGLVDEDALADALASGRLAGAGLDTFAGEPVVSERLRALDTVVLTPHCAGAVADNFPFVVERALANVSSYLASGELPAEDRIFVPGAEHPGLGG